MKIKITSDSTCDLSPELITENNISIFPLTVIKGDKEFKDGVDIAPIDIMMHVDNGGNLCTTSAINVGEYIEYFAPFAKENDAVIHITIGSLFSSCYQNACLAAKEYDNVYVIDSMNLSTGHGHVVMEAAKKVKEGLNPEEICDYLNLLTPRVEASFILDRLDYMVKGGRCSAVTALGANLLKLKPCIEVAGGKMGVCKKYRGSFEKGIANYIQDRLQDRDDIETDHIFITHTVMEGGEPVELARKCVNEYKKFDHVYETKAGCTIFCHCGQNTLGVLFIRKA